MINFFSEDISFELTQADSRVTWLETCVNREGYSHQEINYIFCSDEYLLDINRKHLNHDYYTDIITFDLSELPKQLEADIFISIDRVRENAAEQEEEFEMELNRVLVHGILHLMGYRDKTDAEKLVMRSLENKELALYS